MFRNLEAEQARFGYTNQQMADKSMMFATDNEPREKEVTTIVMTVIFGYQCLRSIWNYQYLLQQVSMCLESVNTVYAALRQFLLTMTFFLKYVKST